MTVEPIGALTAFAAVFIALFAAHSVGDIWVQTHHQALTKGAPGRAGRWACAKHVATLTLTKAVAIGAVMLATGLRLDGAWLCAGLLVDAASHYWADRRTTLARLAERIGKGDFYRLGADHLGSGAHALDQAWHHLWLFVAALIIAGGAA
ncbi:transcriptional regulator [Streptosporangium sp. DT93]|uniref:transcriptional regulator n=1 Tax=Streptosporangium sp. DT93 TaxID=3393428 RepID=UPI003CFABF2C